MVDLLSVSLFLFFLITSSFSFLSPRAFPYVTVSCDCSVAILFLLLPSSSSYFLKKFFQLCRHLGKLLESEKLGNIVNQELGGLSDAGMYKYINGLLLGVACAVGLLMLLMQLQGGDSENVGASESGRVSGSRQERDEEEWVLGTENGQQQQRTLQRQTQSVRTDVQVFFLVPFTSLHSFSLSSPHVFSCFPLFFLLSHFRCLILSQQQMDEEDDDDFFGGLFSDSKRDNNSGSNSNKRT